jgi:hypothetical protein
VDDVSCAECYIGNFVQDGICVSCLANCYSCSDGTSCILCDKGYVWENEECRVSKDPIFTISKTNNLNSSSGSKIQVKFEKNEPSTSLSSQESLQVINELSFGCMTSFKSGCLFCFPKFVLIDEVCEACPKNCLICDINKSCLKCEYSYTITPENGKLTCIKSKVTLINPKTKKT